jgi:hypothetical protein
MKSVAFIFSLILFSFLSFAQTAVHTDINLSGNKILDAKENGFYSAELKEKQENYWEKAFVLRKWNYDLGLDWELEVISQKKSNVWFISEKNQSVFFMSYDYVLDNSINEYIISSPWITSFDSKGIKKKNLILLHNSNLKIIDEFMGDGNLNILLDSIGSKEDEIKEITWLRISDEMEVTTSTFNVPAVSYGSKGGGHYWEMFGSNKGEIYFYSAYYNLLSEEEGTVEFMKVDTSGNVDVVDISKKLFFGTEFLKSASCLVNFTYSSFEHKFVVQTFNFGLSGFTIGCFDMDGENLWKTEGDFNKVVKLKKAPSGNSGFFNVASVFSNGLYGYFFLERESSRDGFAFLYDLDFGDEVAKKTFEFEKSMERYSNKYFVMDMIPDGQAYDFIKGTVNNTKSKKDLKKLKYSYHISGDDELLFLYSKNGTDIYRFTE